MYHKTNPNQANYLSMDQIEQTVCKQMTGVKLWLFIGNTLKPFNCVQKRAQAFLRMLSIKCV